MDNDTGNIMVTHHVSFDESITGKGEPMRSLHLQSEDKTGINRVVDTSPADLHLGKTGKNGIDDMISAALHQMMPVIDGVDDMISTALCTEINAALPLQFDDTLNLLLSDTILAMAEGERITS
jgi:hypothetical protein